jgi:hypothetical protein
MLNVSFIYFMLSVIMLSVIVLNGILLSAVAPGWQNQKELST